MDDQNNNINDDENGYHDDLPPIENYDDGALFDIDDHEPLLNTPTSSQTLDSSFSADIPTTPNDQNSSKITPDNSASDNTTLGISPDTSSDSLNTKVNDNLAPAKANNADKKPVRAHVPLNPGAGADLVHGKIPPQAIESEKLILGSFLIDNEAVSIYMSKIHAEDFYVEKHSQIFRAMKELEVAQNPVDILTVINKLKEMGSFQESTDMSYLADLTDLVASAANVEYHIELVREKATLRRLITACSNAISDSFDPSMEKAKILERAQDAIYEIAEENVQGTTIKAADIVQDTLKLINQYQSGINGVETGFSELDKLTSGLQKTDMIVLAGRPGMGKTAFALSLLANATIKSRKPARSVFFSLEMGGPQLIQRVLCSQANISMQKLKQNELSPEEFNALFQAAEPVSAAPMYIDDQPGLSMPQLRSKCRSLERQLGGLDMVIIDYLQLMEGDSKDGNRNQEVTKISRGLKMLAKDLQVPVIALSQLNRKTEDRPGQEKGIPQLSDLRDSGAIEQDADMVWFVHRPSKYKSRAETLEEDNVPIYDEFEEANLIIAKNRHGPTKTVKMSFAAESASFRDIDYSGFVPNM